MNRESASQKLSDSPTHELPNYYGGYSDVASFIASAASRRKRA
jgi:hypothetical protein